MKHRVLFPLLLLFLLVPATKAQTPATDSGQIDISQSVKERLQSVVRDKNLGITSLPTAFMGTLQSVSGTTLSILTNEGIKLASTSAQTAYVRAPTPRALTAEDLSIDSYITAIGVVRSEDLLDVAQVLVNDEPPSEPATRSFYGTVISYDPDEFLLNLLPPTGEPRQFLISRRASLDRWLPDGTKESFTRTQPIDPNTPVLVIYSEGQGPNAQDLVNELLTRAAE